MNEQLNVAKQFWKVWQSQQAFLDKLSLEHFIDASNQILYDYFADIAIDLVQTLHKKQWIVTAHGALSHFVEVLALQQTAPHGIQITPFRKPLPADEVEDFNISTDTGLTILAQDLSFAVLPMTHLIHLEIQINRDGALQDFETLQDMSLLITEQVLGEWDFAVKIHKVSFVTKLSGDKVSLVELVDKVQQVWTQKLEHTGQYPDEPVYMMAQSEERPDQPYVIITADAMANTMLGHPDFAWCILLETRLIDETGIKTGSDLDEVIRANLSIENNCICALTVLDLAQGIRYMYIYCTDPAWAEKQLKKILTKFKTLENTYQIDYDPTWHWYRF